MMNQSSVLHIKSGFSFSFRIICHIAILKL